MKIKKAVGGRLGAFGSLSFFPFFSVRDFLVLGSDDADLFLFGETNKLFKLEAKHLLNQIRIGEDEYDTFQLAFWIVFAFQQSETLQENREFKDR